MLNKSGTSSTGISKRIGLHLVPTELVYIQDNNYQDQGLSHGQFNTKLTLSLYASKVSAGYPLPCDDSIPEQLDLNEFLIHHPSATFLVRATGDSMIGAGIYDNDILIVDRSLEARHNSIVVAAVDGYLTVKRLWRKNNKCLLIPENSKYQPVDITESCETVIWGVVAHVIHTVL